MPKVFAQNTPTSTVIAYPKTTADTVSSVYTVSVNGTTIPVIKENNVSYAQFAMGGTVAISVKVNQNISSYRLSPKSLNIPSSSSGQEIKFSLTTPHKMLLWKVNNISERLILLAEPLEENPPQIGGSGVVDVSKYSPDKTGGSLATTKIQQAINELPQNGTLYIPPGLYKTTQLNLKSNMTLYIAGGAMLMAPTDTAVGEAILYFSGVNNLTIKGRGVLYGRGSTNRPNNSRFKNIKAFSATNVTIQDIIFRDAPEYHMSIWDSSNWKIDNLKEIVDANYSNTDGMNLNNSHDVIMENLFFYTTDDPIAHSSASSKKLENFTVRSSTLINAGSGGGVKISAEGSQYLSKNTIYENLDIPTAPRCLSALPPAGGTIEYTEARSIRCEESTTSILDLTTQIPDWDPGRSPGIIRNMLFTNIQADGFGPSNSPVTGQDSTHDVENIIFNNFTVSDNTITSPASAHFTTNQYVKNLQFTTQSQAVINVQETTPYANTTTPGVFTFTRMGDTASTITVSYQVRGTAKNGTDYTTIPTALTIPAGATSKTLEIKPAATSTLKTVRISLINDNKIYYPALPAYLLGPHYDAVVTIAPGGSSQTPPPTPQHCQPLGDMSDYPNCKGKVTTLDLSYLLSKISTTDFKADLDNSGTVNVLDLSPLLTNLGV
jgi:polygalacturonase